MKTSAVRPGGDVQALVHVFKVNLQVLQAKLAHIFTTSLQRFLRQHHQWNDYIVMVSSYNSSPHKTVYYQRTARFMLESISHRPLVRRLQRAYQVSAIEEGTFLHGQFKPTASAQTESRAIVSCARDGNTTKPFNKMCAVITQFVKALIKHFERSFTG